MRLGGEGYGYDGGMLAILTYLASKPSGGTKTLLIAAMLVLFGSGLSYWLGAAWNEATDLRRLFAWPVLLAVGLALFVLAFIV